MSDSDDNEALPPRSPYAGIRRSLIALGLLVVVLMFAGQVMPRLYPKHSIEKNTTEVPVVATDDHALTERVDQLESKVKSLEDALAALPKTPDASATDGKLSALQSKFDDLQQKVDHPVVSAAESERNARLQDDVQALKSQMAELQAKQKGQLAALAAMGPLKDAVLRGDPYADEWNQMARLTQGNAAAQAAINTLGHDSAKGIPTLAALQKSFAAALPGALAAQPESRLARELQSFIRIRKVGDRPGTDDEAILARAEDKLGRGEVEAAAEELTSLSPVAAKAMGNWETQAQDYVSARQAVAVLQVALVADDKPKSDAPAVSSAPANPTPPAP